MDVDVFQISNTSIRDNDAEAPSSLSERLHGDRRRARNPPGTITQFATNQTAGTNFTLHLAAYGRTPADPVCGIIEATRAPRT